MSFETSPRRERNRLSTRTDSRGSTKGAAAVISVVLAAIVLAAGVMSAVFWHDIVLLWREDAPSGLLALWWLPLVVSGCVVALLYVLTRQKSTRPQAASSAVSQTSGTAIKTARPKKGGLFSRSVLGIDVGNAQLKIVEIAPGKSPRILNYAMVPTPRGSVENGVIREPAQLRTALEEALQKGKFTARRTATTLTGQNLMLRNLTLPPMPQRELRAAIDWQMDSILQLSREETLTDYGVLPANKDEPNKVMIVAMHKEPILNFVDFMQDVGFEVVCVDIEPLAMFRTVMLASEERVAKGIHLICDFGGGTTNLSVFKDGILQTARVISLGGNHLTRALMLDHQMDFSEAEAIKIAHGFAPDGPYYHSLLSVRDRLFDEIATTFNFFVAENRGITIDSVQLAGGNSLLQGLSEQLEANLREALRIENEDFHVARVNPLPRMSHSVGPEDHDFYGAALSVAIGLALGEV